MSHPLAYANQSLYHASILLSGWRAELTRQVAPEPQVTLAYAPGVREHLLDGYGWLLLAACRIRQAPEKPPHSVADLPTLPDGIVPPAEVEACAQLEESGWVAGLRAPITAMATPRRSDSLAVEMGTSLDQFDVWAKNLGQLAEQIADAIDES